MKLEISLPPSRHVWLLWLLVLTPMCLLPLLGKDGLDLPSLILVLMRLLLLGGALALVNCVWFEKTSPLAGRLAKEFRLQLPGAVLAILVPAFFASIPSWPI